MVSDIPAEDGKIDNLFLQCNIIAEIPMKVLNHGLELLELQDAVLVLLEQPNSSLTSSSSLQS